MLNFSGTGMPEIDQDIKSFARQLCTEKKATGSDANFRNQKKLQPQHRWWITEIREYTSWHSNLCNLNNLQLNFIF